MFFDGWKTRTRLFKAVNLGQNFLLRHEFVAEDVAFRTITGSKLTGFTVEFPKLAHVFARAKKLIWLKFGSQLICSVTLGDFHFALLELLT